MKTYCRTFGLLLALSLSTALGACQDNQPVRIVNTTSFPNLPDITLPPPAELESVRFDLPPNLAQLVIQGTPECQAVAAADRDKIFWARCGQYTAIQDGTIYVTLSRDQFEALRRNIQRLKTRDQQFESRIVLINQQRAGWRSENARNNGLPATPSAAPKYMPLPPRRPITPSS